MFCCYYKDFGLGPFLFSGPFDAHSSTKFTETMLHYRFREETEYIDFHHIGIIYIVNKIEPVSDVTAEEGMRWNDLSCSNLNDLTPFAKEAVLKIKTGSLCTE